MGVALQVKAAQRARSKQLRLLTRERVAAALQQNLDGGQSLVKDLWQMASNDEEVTVINNELRELIAKIRKG